jgi:hypothetical protein
MPIEITTLKNWKKKIWLSLESVLWLNGLEAILRRGGSMSKDSEVGKRDHCAAQFRYPGLYTIK